MPSHTHIPQASSGPPNASTPANNFWAGNTGFAPYSGTHGETMLPAAISNTGGGQSHENESPYLVVNYCIALQGIFPTRN
jgi:microcystin-dependent protein